MTKIDDLDDDFLRVTANTADVSFDAHFDSPEADDTGDEDDSKAPAGEVATRPSGMKVEGFIPGERKGARVPFKVLSEPPCRLFVTGWLPSDDDKRGAWQIQQEYAAERLGKDRKESVLLWNTAKWIDRHYRIATMPANATKTMNLSSGSWNEVVNPEDIRGDAERGILPSFGVCGLKVDERDMKKLSLKLSEYDIVRLMDEFKDYDELAKIDINELAGKEDPLADPIDFPDRLDREESAAIIRRLMLDMGPLWNPVKRAIVDHATMTSLGENQGHGVPATIGRTHVIAGLRFAAWIRKQLSHEPRVSSVWLRRLEARETLRTRRHGVPSVDEIITATLAKLADALPSAPHSIAPADTGKAFAANDNFTAADHVRQAA